MSKFKSQNLDAAVELGFLSKKQLDSIESEQRDSNYPALEIAIRKGYLSRKQLDILNIFAEPESVVPGYRVDGFLGEGGVGVVYKATQLRMDRPVAIKTINRSSARNDLTPKRFEREARIVGQLRHPNIISAFDFGVHDDKLYLVMEFVDGVDAEKQLWAQSSFPESHAWYIARQVCHALDNANQMGIIHRDIKPGNLILTEAPAGTPMPLGVPFVKVADFGLAKFSDQQMDATITMDQSVSGTPFYMSPEQIQASEIDHRSDIYSLGTTIWHLITGAPPIVGNGPLDVISSKMKLEDTWLQLSEGMSEPGFQLLSKMCRHDREQRINDYSELSSEIDSVIDFLGDAESSEIPLSSETAKFSTTAKVLTLREMAKTFTKDGTADAGDSDDFQLAGLNSASGAYAKTEQFDSLVSQEHVQAAAKVDGLNQPTKRRRSPLLWAVALLGVLVLPVAFYLSSEVGIDKSNANSLGNSDPAIVDSVEPDRVRLAEFSGIPIFLFNGTEVDPTQRFTGTWEAAQGGDDGTEGIVLAGQGTRDFRCRNSDREPMVNFRFVCGFRHYEAEIIEFKFIDGDSKDGENVLFKVSINPEMATLTAGGTEHVCKLSKFDEEQSFGFHQFRIEAQPGYWRIEVDRDLLAEIDKPPGFVGDDSLIQLSIEGSGRAHFEGISFHEFADEPAGN